MSEQHPIVDDAELGPLSRATSELTDGTLLTHDWYSGTASVEGSDVTLMIEGTSPAEITPLLPRLRTTITRLGTLRRTATDAVVTSFSVGEPEPRELDEAASDLSLDAVEASADGTIVLHLLDTCGKHFPDGYWPAVHLDAVGAVVTVTVES